MSSQVEKSDFLNEIQIQFEKNSQSTITEFQSLADEILEWHPKPQEWNILACYDHLNLTHDYYGPKIEAALKKPVQANPQKDVYQPSFWGRIYMFFAFNPRYSFPTAAEITPGTALNRHVFTEYLSRQEVLFDTLQQIQVVDLQHTPIPIQGPVNFNLGDCLRILVYHDELHIGQARKVKAAWNSRQ